MLSPLFLVFLPKSLSLSLLLTHPGYATHCVTHCVVPLFQCGGDVDGSVLFSQTGPPRLRMSMCICVRLLHKLHNKQVMKNAFSQSLSNLVSFLP